MKEILKIIKNTEREFTRNKDGGSYKGEFKNDLRDGKGLFRQPDGKSYDGDWKSDKQDGIGIFTDDEGRQRKSKWSKGEFTKWLD